MILAGDLGGTKVLLALCDDGGTVVREQMYAAHDYASLEAIIDAFKPDRVRAACFGVAGPVVGGVAKITNLPWTIAEDALSKKLDARVSLLNDLQATALGALVIPADKFAVIQAAARTEATGTIAVIAPGTGLGEAVLYHDGQRYRALPSEGGHADFAPGTDEEIELLRFLRAKYGGHVSYERVLSGNGFGDLYAFVRERSGAAEPAWLTADFAAGDHNVAITKAALANKDASCVHAVEMFVQILGAEAGNLALRGLCTGGVVIGGGIPPKILPALQTGAMLERFNAKGRFAPWTRALGVRVALEPRAALLGAAHQAATS